MLRFFNKRIMHLLGSAVGLVAVSTTSAAITVDPATSVPVGSRPDGVAAGDFNGDGFPDIAYVTDNPDKIDFLLGDGTGALNFGGTLLLPNSSSPGALVSGDLDLDGDIDLAVALKDFSTVLTAFNDGAGNFLLGPQTPTGNEPRGMDIADFDGDQDLDLALANRDDNTITVLTNTNGSFTSATYSVQQEPRAVAFGDFAGDAQLDLAVTNHDSRSISILTNAGGTFITSATLSVGAQRRPEGIVAADLNGDGLTDLAVATSGNGFNSASIFTATPAGAFTGPIHYPINAIDPSTIAAADLDCDAAIDLITLNQDGGSISILPNLGAGTFGAPITLAAGVSPQGVALTDLDGDGDSDIVVSNEDGNTLSTYINQSCTIPNIPGDINGDGSVNGTDLNLLLSAFETCTGQPAYNPDADLVSIGCIDAADLNILLTNWTN